MKESPEDIQSVRRELKHLAWPVMLQNIFMSLMFFSDIIMLGHYKDSEVALAAVGLSGPITMMIRFTLMSVATAAMAMVARSYGEKNSVKTSANASTALLLGIVIGSIVSLVGATVSGSMISFFVEPDSGLYQQATLYLSITLSAFVMNYLFLICTAILRGVGDTKTPMLITIFSNLLNIIGDYILIYGKLGFPEMGVKGAAISTLVSSCVEGLILFFFIFSNKSSIKLSIRSFWLVNKATMKTLLKIALPAAFEPMITSMGSLLFLKIVAGLGQASLATHHIILRIESLSFMPGLGLSMATGALVGRYLGAKRIDLAELTTKQALMFAIVIMSGVGLTFILFPSFIIMIFTTNKNIVSLGVTCLMIAAIEQPLLGYAMIHQGTFRGAGDTTTPLFINIICVWLIRLPLAFLFANVLNWGLLGIWMTMPIDWLMRAIIYKAVHKRGNWQKIRI